MAQSTNDTIGIGAIAVGLLLIIGIMRGTWQKLLGDVFGSTSSSTSGSYGNGGQITLTPNYPVGWPVDPNTGQPIPSTNNCPANMEWIDGICYPAGTPLPSGGLPTTTQGYYVGLSA